MKLLRALALGAVMLVACPAPAVSPVHVSAHRAIASRTAQSMSLFDRGLVMLFAFNMGEARLDFARAARLDPDCAMAYWGQAQTLLSDINVPPDAEMIAQAKHFARLAARAREASPRDRSLIDALAMRFADTRDGRPEQLAYAQAMRRHVQAYPSDADGLFFAALARWRADDPAIRNDGVDEIGQYLDRAVALDAAHLGVRHLRIHFYEFTHRSRRAIGDAQYLAHLRYDLGESHLPHMAGHIWLRLGDYAATAAANQVARDNDAAYFKRGTGPGQAYMADYHMHVVTNELYALTTLGDDAKARAVVSSETNAMRSWVDVRDRRWPIAKTPADMNDAVNIGVASARHGDLATAARMRDILRTKYRKEYDLPRDLALLDAARALQQRHLDAALKTYEGLYTAYDFEAADPPGLWSLPIPEAYGALLLRHGYWKAAMQVFTRALMQTPGDPRLLFGLAVAEQHAGFDARAHWQAYLHAWHRKTPLTIDDLG